MNILRWIFFLPIALALGFLIKLGWDISNRAFWGFDKNILQWIMWGTGEVIGALVFFYVAIRIVPTKKRAAAYALCGLGIVLGMLTIGYLVYLFTTLGIRSEDPSFRQDIIEGLASGMIETGTAIIFMLYIRKGKLEHWLQME